MRSPDVTTRAPELLLVARLHVDLCRLASALCVLGSKTPNPAISG
jgi:hypothetical protein